MPNSVSAFMPEERTFTSLPSLVIPLATVTKELHRLAEEGEKLGNAWRTFPHDDSQRVNFYKEMAAWFTVVADLLDASFSEKSVAVEFEKFFPLNADAMESPTWTVYDAIDHITILIRRIEFRARITPTKPDSQSLTITPAASPAGRKVFVVHGHDVAARESVARFLARLGLVPVILHEQADEGKAIIEKFEKHADVFCAVVLLTPDDVGGSTGKDVQLRLRARQNVIFELGYFVGKLGRQRVCVLHRGNVEIPSDYHGIIYVPLDEQGAWKLVTARNLRSAGLPVDLNLAL